MIAPFVLLSFTFIAATAGRSFLFRAAWVHGSPRWGIWAWQALSVAIALAILLTSMTLAIPLLPIRSRLAELARITPLELDAHYATPGGPWLAGIAIGFAIAITARVVVLFIIGIHRGSRERRAQLDTLALVGDRHPDGYVVINHSIPLVYCLPGRGRQVVVTSSALDLLSPHELSLVLAHERTHLRARHDLALTLADALARTFVPLRVFDDARAQIATLVEMQADDAAREAGDRRAMARALVALAVGGGQEPSSAAGSNGESSSAAGGNAVARVRRLTTPDFPLGLRRSAGVALATAFLLAAPIGLALAPAVEASVFDCCEADL